MKLRIVLLGITTALALRQQHDKESKGSTACQQFSLGVQLNDSQVLGSWYLLVSNVDAMKNTRHYCATITEATNQECKYLKDRVDKYVENLIWDNLTLKMQFPCSEDKSNRTKEIYFEKLGSDGSYRSLQVPKATRNLDLSLLHRYPMRFKLIDDDYLVIMTCQEKITFIMGRLNNEHFDKKVNKIIDTFWTNNEH